MQDLLCFFSSFQRAHHAIGYRKLLRKGAPTEGKGNILLKVGDSRKETAFSSRERGRIQQQREQQQQSSDFLFRLGSGAEDGSFYSNPSLLT